MKIIVPLLLSLCAPGIYSRTMSNVTMNPFIVSGDYPKIQKVPHVVLLRISCNGKKWWCSASILNEKIVITAAHCVSACQHPEDFVQAGVGSTKQYRQYPYYVKGFIIHPQYNFKTLQNDISLGLIRGKFKYGSNVKRIALSNTTYKHEMAVVAGWGYHDEVLNEHDDILRSLVVRVWDTKECQKAMSHVLPPGVICAGEKDHKKYVARGDSGSGLVVRRYLLIGVLSYKNLKSSRSLAMYSDVAYFYDWIVKTAADLIRNC